MWDACASWLLSPIVSISWMRLSSSMSSSFSKAHTENNVVYLVRKKYWSVAILAARRCRGEPGVSVCQSSGHA